MKSRLDSLSTELIYEIFDYLKSLDVFIGFLGLNKYFNRIVHLYPIKVDFKEISRSNFDFICRNIQPEQVYSLRLSEEFMPDQIKLLNNYFPRFEKEFIHLKTMEFIFIKHLEINLPISVSSLTFKKEFPGYKSGIHPQQLISQQAQFLTYLQIGSIHAMARTYNRYYSEDESINNARFNVLTHLIINEECDFYEFNDRLRSIQLSSLVHLNISIKNDYETTDKRFLEMYEEIFQMLSSLTYLKIKFGKIASFDSLAQCLIKSVHLKSLTIEAEGQSDLIDAVRWEKFIRKTQISNFNFRLSRRSMPTVEEPLLILEQFRSPFWLEEKCWYVGCTQRKEYWRPLIITEIYSLPYFRSQILSDDMKNYPPLSTASEYMHDKLFFQNQISSYSYYAGYKKRLFDHPMIKVNKLELTENRFSHELINRRQFIDNLTSLVNLKHVQELNLYHFSHRRTDLIHLLLTHTSRLHTLIMSQLNPSLIIPEHIHSLILPKINSSIFHINHDNIHELSQSLSSIRHLEIPVVSKSMMIDIIDQFIQLTSLVCVFDSEQYGTLEDISTEWFQQNTRRLKNDTCDQNQIDIKNTMNYKLHESFSTSTNIHRENQENPISSCFLLENNFTWYRRLTIESYKQGQQGVCGHFRPDECICLSMIDSRPITYH